MALENIILGLLSQPASGYDLKRTFDTVINYFWYADIAQVYRTLQRMETNGLLKSKELPSEQGPQRKVYRRTAAGRKQLHQWIRHTPEIGQERHAYVAQLVFLGELDRHEETLRFLRQLRDAFTSRHAVLKHIEASEPDLIESMNADDFHGFLGLRMGIQITEARISWYDDAIKLAEKRNAAQQEK